MSLFAYRRPQSAVRSPVVVVGCSPETQECEPPIANRGQRTANREGGIADGGQRASGQRTAAGVSLVELMLVVGIIITVVGVALPITTEALDTLRTASAARYLAGRIHQARMDAIKRSANVALRFEPDDEDYKFTTYLDGNRNGVRRAEINAGIDPPLGAPERLTDNFSVVRFGLLPGIPDFDGGAAGDGVRIGAARILTTSPNGTATPGTLYLHGRRAQYAVRVLGATGRTRVLAYDRRKQTWIIK